MKYVVASDYYPNCRSCDSGYYSQLLFFKNIKEILLWALENKSDYELKTVYSCKTGKELFEVGYEIGKHSCTGVYFEYKGLHIRTIDNGKGDLIWTKL